MLNAEARRFGDGAEFDKSLLGCFPEQGLGSLSKLRFGGGSGLGGLGGSKGRGASMVE